MRQGNAVKIKQTIMNNIQKTVLIIALALLAIAALFVPTVSFYSDGSGGNSVTYRMITDDSLPPSLGVVTVARFDIMLVEIVGIGVAGGIGYLLARGTKKPG
jgi:hypothetical protein